MTANVLVVDDIESNVKLLEAKLLGEYYTVFTANNGKDALDVLALNRIDIVLLDAMMPNIDGFEICKRIKSNPYTIHIPVIMVTALSDTEDRIKGLEAGADEFLTKPIDDTALFARVRSLARMKAVIDELKLRNTTNAELGGDVIEVKDNFSDSKILLVNDDIVQARNINKMLLSLTPNIKIISDINELEKDSEYTPDLVIISCQLEQGDPLRISVMLRSDAKFHDTVLILQAEEENTSIVIKGLELGINDYFTYPVDKNELLARIRTQLKRKHYQDTLRNDLELSVNLSIKDGLTGIFNRHYFDTHIKQMVKKSTDSKRPLCLLMCDIDHFKQVNDTYGHQAGDIVLKTIANVLKSIFRVTDLVARYGGEEFAILLNDITIDEAMYIAQRARTRVESIDFKVKTQKDPIKKTISIGVTEYKIGESISDFIERTDKALYQAKEDGRNKVIRII
ncbi:MULTISPECIES: PleD family two-component system response regulator [unclassified Candidatus Tisiphia]|uniref:PleD family two-component system response regulator n=1 Tax=unclassified Candidatus Tisiphia TaxID=2996318 RepID=UPI00312CA69A|nr:PleD family two-component system response regulator [Rickettsiaceae bacterium]MDD9337811.1 PleD family two-component system response regulator [Rickettsiaceae bacterium]